MIRQLLIGVLLVLGSWMSAGCGALNSAPLKNEGTVVVADNPGRYELMAKDDLLEFLPKLSGVAWKAVDEKSFVPGDKYVVFLGDTAMARKNGLKKEDFDREQWRIKSIRGGLLITGGKPIGTLYGTYDFLKHFGVRFIAPDETYVPTAKSFGLEKFDVNKKPSYDARLTYDFYPNMVIDHYGADVKWIHEDYNRHRLRMGINGTQAARHPAWYHGEFYSKTVGNLFHNYIYYLNPKDYMKDHPEYYSLGKDGKRYFGHFCWSNPAVRQEVLNNLRKFILRDRKEAWFGVGEYRVRLDQAPVFYMIGQMDSNDQLCHCDNCQKIIDEEGGDAGLQMRAINYIAREIRKEFPDIKIITMAYNTTEAPPKITKPESNVYVSFDDLYVSSDSYRPITSSFNEKQLEKINAWLKLTPNILLSDFGNIGGKNYFNPPRQEVTVDAVIADLRYFNSRGIRLFFEEYEKDPVTPQPFFDLHCYLKAALMMDVTVDAEELIREFIELYYGKAAAPIMLESLNKMRAGMKIQPNPQRCMQVIHWKYCTAQYMRDAYIALNKAHELAGPATKYGRRVREEMIPLLWELLYFRKDYLPALEAAGVKLEVMKKQCMDFTTEYVTKYGGTKVPQLLKDIRQRFDNMFINLDADDRFKGYAPGEIKVFGYPHAVVKRNVSEVVEDKDTPVGKALCCWGPAFEKHGKKEMSHGVWSTFFAFHDGRTPRGTIGLRVKKIPQDEKYHWYRVPQLLDCSNEGDLCMWTFYGYLEFNMATLWTYIDGVPDFNIYDVWFSAKFTGPAYVNGSTQRNAIWVDRVVAIRHSVAHKEDTAAE